MEIDPQVKFLSVLVVVLFIQVETDSSSSSSAHLFGVFSTVPHTREEREKALRQVYVFTCWRTG